MFARILPVGAALALATSAPAAVTYTGQQRVLAAYASPSDLWDGTLPAPTGADVRSSPGMAVFSNAVSLSAPASSGPTPGSAAASTVSSLTPTGVLFDGTARGADTNPFGGVGVGMGVSYLRADFVVSTPTAFELNLAVSGTFTNSFTWATARLRDAADNVVGQWTMFEQAPSQGTLPPGAYTLVVDVRAGYSGFGTGSGSITYSGHLNLGAPPCPADYNHQNGVDLLDVFAFLSDWFAQNPNADFNHQNGCDLLDIFAFLTAWFAGC